MTLSEALKAWRQEHGVTVRELALRTGIPLETVRGIETDTILPEAVHIPPLCHLLSMPAHRLLRVVGASAHRMLLGALETPGVRAIAARHLDDCLDAEGPELPVAIQAAIARQGSPVEDALALYRQAPQARREIWVASVVADLELEGEEEWLAEL